MTPRTLADFTWTDALTGLRHPGPPPPGLPAIALLLLAACATALAVMIRLGRLWHGDSHFYLRERQPGTYLSVLLLVAAGVLCWRVAAALREAPFARFWRVASVGFVWLGCDELFLLHESIDYWIHRLLGLDPRHPVTRHFDDLIIAAYGVLALVLAHRYRADLVRLRWMVLILGLGFPLFVTMVAFDLFDWNQTIEDSLKLLAGTIILIAFCAARLELTGRTR